MTRVTFRAIFLTAWSRLIDTLNRTAGQYFVPDYRQMRTLWRRGAVGAQTLNSNSTSGVWLRTLQLRSFHVAATDFHNCADDAPKK